MADLLPTNFPIPSENVIASYNFLDIIQSVGYGQLYLGDTASNKIMSNIDWYSYGGVTSILNNTIDIDFDIIINRPLTLNGKMIVFAQFGLELGPAAGAQAVATTWTAKLRKWDGSSETEIANGSATVSSVTNVTPGSIFYKITSVDFTVTNSVFKAGDTLRLTFATTSPGDPNKGIHIIYDPKGRDVYVAPLIGSGTAEGETRINQSIALIPIKLEL